jgi:hypothetical protein
LFQHGHQPGAVVSRGDPGRHGEHMLNVLETLIAPKSETVCYCFGLGLKGALPCSPCL